MVSAHPSVVWVVAAASVEVAGMTVGWVAMAAATRSTIDGTSQIGVMLTVGRQGVIMVIRVVVGTVMELRLDARPMMTVDRVTCHHAMLLVTCPLVIMARLEAVVIWVAMVVGTVMELRPDARPMMTVDRVICHPATCRPAICHRVMLVTCPLVIMARLEAVVIWVAMVVGGSTITTGEVAETSVVLGQGKTMIGVGGGSPVGICLLVTCTVARFVTNEVSQN
jgi:hypothetical protein